MEQKWWAASVRKNTVMIAFNDFDPEFPGFRTVPSWRGFGSSLPCRRETTAQHQMDHTSGVCLHHHSYFAFFHLERFLSAYISELKKGLFHVEIFRQTGLFKNCDNRYKTINYINSKHFYFSKLSLLFWSLAWKIHWAPLKLAVCSSSHCASLVLKLHLLTSPLLFGCEEGQGHLHAGKWCWRRCW